LYWDEIDPYIDAAAAIYRKDREDIDKDERQVGKVAELSLQFGGGENAFLGMARNYGVTMSTGKAKQVKTAWRQANPWAQNVWKDIERAVMLALRKPGEVYSAGRLDYFTVKDILCGGLTLFCRLPCGRVLTYPDVRVELVEGEYGVRKQITCLRAQFMPKANEKEWPRSSLWGGLLFENAVQGTAASLLRWAVRECEFEGLPVVMHVHDEIVLEVGEFMQKQFANELAGIMNRPPGWATGLPLKAEVVTMERFGK